MDGRKLYRFTVRWGEERDTDDAEGAWSRPPTRARRRQRSRALLPHFTGTIEQIPPRFSAIKVEGERAYDLAREGESVALEPRPVEIHDCAADRDARRRSRRFRAECGKGTYVRALVRDLGRRSAASAMYGAPPHCGSARSARAADFAGKAGGFVP